MRNKNVDIDRLLEAALVIPDPRAKRTILYRYSLASPEKKTLAELGKEYNLTRERIRQIEAATLKAIRKKLQEDEGANRFLELVHSYLNDVGYLRRADLAVHDLAILFKQNDEDSKLYHKFRFLIRALGQPFLIEGNDQWHPFWYNKEEAYETAKLLVSHLLKFKDHDFDKFLRTTSSKLNLPDVLIINHVCISRRFMISPYGDLGADHWTHVNPKTVRDKAYLVLTKSGRPLHFREIARLVNNIGNKERASATVHNELIKDPRFVLVGRGTYTINV